MEAFITLITDDKLDIIIIKRIATDQADHILKPVIPLAGRQIGRSQAEIAFAFLRAAEAFGQRCAVHIEVVVEG